MVSEPLFRDIKFIFDGPLDETVRTLLHGGASQFSSLASAPGQGSIHLITHDYNSPISLAAQLPPYNHRVTICTPKWVETSATKGRIQDVRRFSPDPRQFFTGVCVTCTALSQGDKEAIYGGVLALGGQYSEALVKGTTHVVTMTMDSDKVREVLQRPDSGVEIVLPHWFDDCLRLRRRIPSEPYLFPDPRILNTNYASVPPSATAQDADFRHLCDSKAAMAEAPDTDEDIFSGKKFYLSSDLGLGERLLGTLCAVLGSANAVLVRQISVADVYLGNYRDGHEYLTAARSNKIVGNYTWVIYCLARGKYSAPRDHLLHYPLARGGLPDFSKDIITVSNYTGEARLYLERLITALGAKFTRNMRPENTHLITAAESGEKYNTAKQWGISCVNHLWLEESYAKWQKQAITMHHYVTFPKETNLMDVIAQTPVLNEGLEPFYLVDDTDDEEDALQAQVQVSAPPPASAKASVIINAAEEESQDITLPDLSELRRHPDSLPAGTPLLEEQPQTDRVNGKVKESSTVANPPVAPARSTPKPKDLSKDMFHATPVKNTETTPSSRGSTARKASQTAASRLRDNMEDANKFGQQMRNKHKLPPLPSEAQPASKKPKTSASSSPVRVIKAVMTGCPELTETIENQAEALGIQFVEDPVEASHLVAPRVARTRKFVVAIPKCAFFVNWEWLLASIRAQKVLPEQQYPPEAAPPAPWSKRLDFTKVLERVKSWRSSGGLFHGYTLLVSDAVTKIGGFETYREIVAANGGSCGLIGRRGINTKEGKLIMIFDDKNDPAFAKHVESRGKNGGKGKENKDAKQLGKAECYDREWLMTCAIRQELQFDDKLKLC